MTDVLGQVISELQERLKEPDGLRLAYNVSRRHLEVLLDAANETERLRKALRALYRWAERQPGWDTTEWRDVRDALKQADKP